MDSLQRLSIEDAAHRLGLSVSTLRRRIRAGSLAVEREETPQGYRYVVLVPAEVSAADAEGHGAGIAALADSDQLAELVAEREWLRRRVEELTTLLNREQEAVLRLASERESARLPAATDNVPAVVPITVAEPQPASPVEAVAFSAEQEFPDSFVLAAKVRKQLKEAGVRKKVRRRLVHRLMRIVGG